MKAIALHTIQTNDKGGVVKLFTEPFGVRAYYVNWGKNSMLYQAMTLLEVEERERKKGSMALLTEVRRDPLLHEVASRPAKAAVALFMAEVLHRALAEDQPHPELFDFCHLSIQALDLDDHTSLYPLMFLTRMISHLGFAPPHETKMGHAVFDLIGGEWLATPPLHGQYLEGREAQAFTSAIRMPRETVLQVFETRESRTRLLELLLRYLQIHLHSEQEVRSFAVLREVFA